MSEERPRWERVERETSRQYAAFRAFRDLGITRTVDAVTALYGGSVPRWARAYSWVERAESWDDELARTLDRERLAAVAEMHRAHSEAGRIAREKALEALGSMRVDEIPPSTAVRLLEVGTKLERSTLTVSVEELQGLESGDDDGSDPWETIARELQGS